MEAVPTYICVMCEKLELNCTCGKFCTMCKSDEDARLCFDGCYYCQMCRDACDLAVEN